MPEWMPHLCVWRGKTEHDRSSECTEVPWEDVEEIVSGILEEAAHEDTANVKKVVSR